MKWQKYKKNHCISIRLYLTFFWTGREGMYCTIPNYQDLPTNYQQPASNFVRHADKTKKGKPWWLPFHFI